MQPGDTIHPNSQEPAQPELATPPVAPTPEPATVTGPVEEHTAAEHAVTTEPGSITWRASEYIEHQKPAGWYALLALVALVVAAITYLLTKDFISTGTILIASVLFGIVAARKPQTLDYVIDHNGIRIGQTLHTYEAFKTFSVVDDGAMRSVLLLPLKRFMPPLSLYYPPEEENAVIETLGLYIPYQEAAGGGFDRLMGRIRF